MVDPSPRAPSDASPEYSCDRSRLEVTPRPGQRYCSQRCRQTAFRLRRGAPRCAPRALPPVLRA